MSIDYKTKNDEMQRLIEQAALLVRNSVKPARFEHSVRVSQMALRLCLRYGQDTDWGYFAGLIHDVCKDMDDQTVILLAKEDGFAVTSLEREKPALLHGRAAAVLLENDFGINCEAVLDAVRSHTFGHAAMCGLAKIIYVADKVEPGRNYDTAVYDSLIEKLSLDGLCARVIAQNIAFLTEKGKAVSPLSLEFLESVQTV